VLDAEVISFDAGSCNSIDQGSWWSGEDKCASAGTRNAWSEALRFISNR
jgi:hypothetical protein